VPSGSLSTNRHHRKRSADAALAPFRSDVVPTLVEAAAYIESLKREGKATAKIKARLSALRNLCDYVASNGAREWNPFKVVRAPRGSAAEGKTPILEVEDVRALFASIGTLDVVGLRDRAILSVMLYAFARVGAVVKMDGRHYEVGRARGDDCSAQEAGAVPPVAVSSPSA